MSVASEFNRSTFYNSLRHAFGPLTGGNVAGLELMLNEAIRRDMPTNKLAYTLATVWWETARTMQPVVEAYWVYPHDRKRHDEYMRTHSPSSRYYPYFGRSYPQWTWKRNYELATRMWNERYRVSDEARVDFVAHPDLILDPKYGIPLFFDGMEEGWFTGKDLEDYIDDVDESDVLDLAEYRAARRVVNGTDKAATIGGLAITFEHALRDARYGVA